MKWRTYPADVLPLWVAEMDVPLAGRSRDRLRAARRRRRHRLPGGDELRRGAGRLRRATLGLAGFDRSTAPAPVPDVMLGIVEVLKLVTEPGRRGGRHPAGLPAVLRVHRRTPAGGCVEAPLAATAGSTWRAGGGVRRARRRPGACCCSPTRTTRPGWCTPRAELAAVAELAGRHGVRVISDEIHAPLVLPGARFTPYLSVPATADGFALFSASKGWNLAGPEGRAARRPARRRDDLARLPEEVGHGPEPPRGDRPHRGVRRRRRVAGRSCCSAWTANRSCSPAAGGAAAGAATAGRRRRRTWPGSTAASPPACTGGRRQRRAGPSAS